MIRPLLCVALSTALLAAVPALAQTYGTMAGMTCSEASMRAANDSMMKMTDAGKKMAVMKEMDMAKDMMAQKDDKGCSAQLHKAMGMMTGMDMKSGMDMKMMAPDSSDSASTKGYKAAMMKMMEGMPTMKFTGDADLDFMVHMRPHHQLAVDMAKVDLANGKDAEVRKLAQDIITAQEREIAVIDAWLKAKGK
jgi:uncharacterized protein (DUF305 family)